MDAAHGKSKEDGIHASSRDYRAYDQVQKPQDYRLAEAADAAHAEVFDDDYRIATCDLGRWLRGDDRDKKVFAEELGSALQDIGFAILEGHGVDTRLYEDAEAEVERVFTGHSLEEKLRFRARREGAVNQGYFPFAETSDIHPDLVEGWVFCRRAFALGEEFERTTTLADFWPDPVHEGVFRPMCQAHERLFVPIMQCLLTYLGCDPHTYDQRLTSTNFALRLNYYPPIEVADRARGAGRLLGHEDIDLFTLLPAPRSEGLQVLNRRNSKWVRLNAPPGSIVLNIGDYLQRLSNDVLPSTTHRVSQPADPALLPLARVSFPTNVYLREGEVLVVLPGLGEPKYEPVEVMHFHTSTTAKYYGDDYATTR